MAGSFVFPKKAKKSERLLEKAKNQSAPPKGKTAFIFDLASLQTNALRLPFLRAERAITRTCATR
eukprot:5051425-Prymnesium_polylepis.1